MLENIKSVEVPKGLPALLNRVRSGGEAVILRRTEKEIGVLLNMEDFRLLLAPERLKKLKELSPGEIETLEILSNVEQARVLLSSLKEADTGETVPIESVLED